MLDQFRDRYLGRLCYFNACPKDKRDCMAPGCGAIRFNKTVDGFKPSADLLEPARHGMLFERGKGRLRSALDLPLVSEPVISKGK